MPPAQAPAVRSQTRSAPIYATIWRWHCYAGLFVIPFVLILAITGSIYLFKPQIESFEERAFQHLPVAAQVSPTQQTAAALAAFPQAHFGNYRLPRRVGDATMITLKLPDAKSAQVFVAPAGQVTGSLDPQRRLAEVVKKIHSQLLLGPRGSWLVELAASWAFVLMASGLYLWWPRGRRLAGVVWPRIGAGGRVRWRDLHAVTAFWLYGLIAVLLLTSLPWTSVWGSAFQTLRSEMGWVQGAPEWTLGGEPPAPADPHAGHAANSAMPVTSGAMVPAGLDAMVARAEAARLPFPVYVTPPGGMGRFGVRTGNLWTIFSDTQNRPQQRTLTFDPHSGNLLNSRNYDGGNRIDAIIGLGIAWHEGQLFGWLNQAIGLLTALGLVGVAISGFLMWRRRQPDNPLAPPIASGKSTGAWVILLVLAAFLPLLALSLLILLLFDRGVRPLLAWWTGRRANAPA